MRILRIPALLVLAAFSWVSAGEETDIHFPEDDQFLPPSWIEEPIGASVEPIVHEMKPVVRRILDHALSKYPGPLLKAHFNGVHVVSSLKFYDVSYGGTYMANARRIVLVYREGFDERGFEQRFHHEFSSLLLKKNQPLFDEDRWSGANAPGFTYRASGVIEEQLGDRSEATLVLAAEQQKTGGTGSTLLQLDETLMKDGFLTPYNRVSIEQDLNETAAHLFTNDDLWHYCRLYPRLDQKVHVLIEFYRALHPSLDRLYFRHLTVGREDTLSSPR